MRLNRLHQPLMERQIHSPVSKHTDDQSAWRSSRGDNKSFGGVNMNVLKKKKKK